MLLIHNLILYTSHAVSTVKKNCNINDSIISGVDVKKINAGVRFEKIGSQEMKSGVSFE